MCISLCLFAEEVVFLLLLVAARKCRMKKKNFSFIRCESFMIHSRGAHVTESFSSNVGCRAHLTDCRALFEDLLT